MDCKQCEIMVINGIKTHEIGCPDSWKDYSIGCHVCGFEFIREGEYQITCDGCIQEVNF
jgi:hypothetical protein